MLAACGTAGSETPAASNDGATTDDAGSIATASSTIPTSDNAGSAGDTSVTDPPATTDGRSSSDGEAADEASPSLAWPDDGCSADNSPSPTEAADAPAPTLEIRAESAASPLPDLAVRRLNCNGGWVNLRNELPSELPLLVWFWAPH